MNYPDKYKEHITDKLDLLRQSLKKTQAVSYEGKIKSATGVLATAELPHAKIGDLCIIEDKSINLELNAEVISIENGEIKLLPFGNINNLSNNTTVKLLSGSFEIKVGYFLLGKMLDGLGNVIAEITDEADELKQPDNSPVRYYPIIKAAPPPLNRKLISEPMLTGVSAIDLFITCGKGQRLAIFAGPGMGKTTLMAMIIRYIEADVIVIALIGERGREVREFIEVDLDKEVRKKCVLITVTSDQSSMEQVKAAYVAHTVAEFFRDEGLDVVLLMDSVTRFARAQREVGLSAGEPLTRGGFPPSVFFAFPRLMERAGNNDRGSITAFYTVLMEGSATSQDPIADEIRSIVDGHIILSNKLVELGHFPAIDVLASLSRIADKIISPVHLQTARSARMLLSKYEELEFLLRVGEYKKGQDKIADQAIENHAQIMKVLQQNTHIKGILEEQLNKLASLANIKS